MKEWQSLSELGAWIERERNRRKMSQDELAGRISGLLREQGLSRVVRQQSVDQVERAKLKSIPDWARMAERVFEEHDGETKEDAVISLAISDVTVMIKRLPTLVGAGAYYGTGEGDEGEIAFSRALVETVLRAKPENLLAIEVEGNSMEPDYYGGDQILIDTNRKTLASPGAFCLWDGDGHVIKYLERVHGSEPPAVKVIAKNAIYEPHIRLLEEINIQGRVIWFGRQVK